MQRLSKILALLSLAGCADFDAPVSPQLDVLTAIAPATNAEPKSRPWKSRCEGIAIFTDPTTLRISGVCNITHLGRATFTATESVIPGPQGFTLSATTTYTAANGDKLYTTSTGIAVFTPDFSGVTFSGIEIAAGGTGKLRNARGRATRIGSTRLSDNQGSYANVGELVYGER
jgi:hypothetical protein